MRVYLLGYMYSGKSTLGRLLASRLGYTFMDTDQAIEEKYRLTIPLFFSRYGEAAFRIVERQMLQSTAALDDTVIALGGGTPCNDDNIAFIKDHGVAIYMEMSVEEIMERAMRSRKQRPLLTHLSTEERHKIVESQLREREAYYRQAHHTVHAALPQEQLLEKLVELAAS